MLVEHLEGKKQLPNSIDLYLALNLTAIAEALKMKEMEKLFVKKYLRAGLDRENVIFFLRESYN